MGAISSLAGVRAVSMNQWLRGGSILALGFAWSVAAVGIEPQRGVWHYIILPGFLIVTHWLHINFWKYPRTAFCVGIVLNTLIYSVALAICLMPLRILKRPGDSRR